jgi:hypothetical protein
MSIMWPDFRHSRRKNEKDRPPIHSRELSLQITLLNVRGLTRLFDLLAEGLACFELDDF